MKETNNSSKIAELRLLPSAFKETLECLLTNLRLFILPVCLYGAGYEQFITDSFYLHMSECCQGFGKQTVWVQMKYFCCPVAKLSNVNTDTMDLCGCALEPQVVHHLMSSAG